MIPPTPLHAVLCTQIARTGPISVADYMRTCLLHPTHGYYTTRQPFGAQGDFITAPEVSQMFGELLGLVLAQAWMDQGAPAVCTLAELGPGRGTLMADILRATRAVPGFHAAMRVHLIEAAPALRTEQASRVPHATWVDSLADLPKAPLFVVANEFFDALPIRQFIRAGAGWTERVIGLDAGGTLTFGLTPAAPLDALTHRLDDTRDGDLVETCTPAQHMAADLGARIGAHGGMGLLIDYGDWRSLGDTLQALSAHRPIDPLATPGQADLTAHVDFEAIATAVTQAPTPCAHTRLCPQGIFLERLGITARAQSLARNMTEPALGTHIAAHRRLTHPQEMGTLFKVLGLYPKHGATPAGLEP
ncbi:MAG: class I SAM-dependent methyltransferase [Paracoccaceae bacterium]